MASISSAGVLCELVDDGGCGLREKEHGYRQDETCGERAFLSPKQLYQCYLLSW